MKKLFALAVVTCLVAGCGVLGAGAPECAERGALCADELLAGRHAGLTDNRFYLPAPGAGAALHPFSGTLRVEAVGMSPWRLWGARRGFPAFVVEFVSVDGLLVPLERDIIPGGEGDPWDLILSPGRVWSEPGDNGMSRASFPFTLVGRVWNEAHNGVATFLYDDAGTSHLRLQVTQETAEWRQVDLWAVTPTAYSPAPVPANDPRLRDFEDERARRIEARPWSELTRDFPGVDMSEFHRNLAPEAISAAGIIVDDVVYYQEAITRHGAYPYPLEMRHGVFSVTKSAGAALTLLRLAELYGERVFDLLVADYLEEAASHDGWNGVTFGHLLSMVAGIGDRWPEPAAIVPFADENDDESPIWNRLWHTPATSGRLRLAFGYGDYPWGPGEVVRYNSAHTFILGAAMDAFYESMEGPDADLWGAIERDVYRPIGIPVVPTMMTEPPDPLPVHAFGFFLNTYDTARIAQLFLREGAWEGQPLLHRDRTLESLYRADSTGYDSGEPLPTPEPQDARYLNSFWSFTLAGPGGCTARVPYMWGYGGNFVTLLPSGVAAYRYADGNVHDPVALALVAARLRPVC